MISRDASASKNHTTLWKCWKWWKLQDWSLAKSRIDFENANDGGAVFVCFKTNRQIQIKVLQKNRTDFENASDGGAAFALRQSVSVETATVTVSESISSFFSTVNRYMLFWNVSSYDLSQYKQYQWHHRRHACLLESSLHPLTYTYSPPSTYSQLCSFEPIWRHFSFQKNLTFQLIHLVERGDNRPIWAINNISPDQFLNNWPKLEMLTSHPQNIKI